LELELGDVNYGLMEFAGVDKAARSKTWVWKMKEWTHWHDVSRVDTGHCRGGHCGSGQCRRGQMPVEMCSRQVV